MVSEELIKYLESERSKGHSREQLRVVLLQGGYPEEEINKAMMLVHETDVENEDKKHSPKILIIVLVILVLGIGGAGFFFYGPIHDYASSFAKEKVVSVNGETVQEEVINNNTEEEIAPSESEESMLESDNPDVENEIVEMETNTSTDEITQEKKIYAATFEIDEICGEEIIYCGVSDTINDCFIEQAENCCPAKIIMEREINSNITITIETVKEIQGYTNETCQVLSYISYYAMTYSETYRASKIFEGMTKTDLDAEQAEMNLNSQSFIGRNYYCRYNAEELVQALTEERDGLGTSYSEEKCFVEE